jgi:uncharacterized membrane protein YvbJ
MRKCPNCAEENINESLFCKHCGRCLLAPDPEEGQRSTAMYTERHKTPEGIDFYDGHILKKSRVARLKRRYQTEPSVIVGWLLLLNLLVFTLMSEIARYIVSR